MDSKGSQGSSRSGYMKQLVTLERELIGRQRIALIDLRDSGAINDDVLRRFQVLLDLEESRLEEEETPLE